MSETHLALYAEHMGRVEAFVTRFLPVTDWSLADLLSIQYDLLHYQWDLQRAIAEEGSQKRDSGSAIREVVLSERKEERRVELRHLESSVRDIEGRINVLVHAQRLARLIGDSVAWYALLSDQQYIYSRSLNQRSRALPTDVASINGVVTVAKHLYEQGLGFPVIHDITNWLRIGDLTLTLPGHEPICVEVKTHRQEIEGQTRYVITAEFLSSRGFTPPSVAAPPLDFVLEKFEGMEERLQLALDHPHHSDQRVRQIARMVDAWRLQSAEPNSLVSVRGTEVIMGKSERDDTSYHWDTVAELVAEARRDGYASRTVDGAFLYFASYSEEPVWYPWQRHLNLPSWDRTREVDLQSSGIFLAEPDRKFVYLGGTWHYLAGEVSPLIEPFPIMHSRFLPMEAILDILHGRLSIGVLINTGRLVEALMERGIDARVLSDVNGFQQWLIAVDVTTVTPDGEAVSRRLEGLHSLGYELLHHFLSMPAFVEQVRQMVEQVAELDRLDATSDTV